MKTKNWLIGLGALFALSFCVCIGIIAWSTYVNARGENLLECAANGDIDCARSLISSGVAVNFKFESGETALMFAVGNDRLDMAIFLLNKGANPNSIDDFGESVLDHCSTDRCKTLITQAISK